MRTSAADYYTAATIGGANALGRPDLGRLTPGALADITIFDLDGFHLGQFIDPIQTMVLSGSGRDFKTVIVNGRIVVRDRQIDGVDFAEMRDAGTASIMRRSSNRRRSDHLSIRPWRSFLFSPSLTIHRD